MKYIHTFNTEREFLGEYMSTGSTSIVVCGVTFGYRDNNNNWYQGGNYGVVTSVERPSAGDTAYLIDGATGGLIETTTIDSVSGTLLTLSGNDFVFDEQAEIGTWAGKYLWWGRYYAEATSSTISVGDVVFFGDAYEGVDGWAAVEQVLIEGGYREPWVSYTRDTSGVNYNHGEHFVIIKSWGTGQTDVKTTVFSSLSADCSSVWEAISNGRHHDGYDESTATVGINGTHWKYRYLNPEKTDVCEKVDTILLVETYAKSTPNSAKKSGDEMTYREADQGSVTWIYNHSIQSFNPEVSGTIITVEWSTME